MNKDELPEGPWQQEPDRVEWKDEATGLDCLILRGPVGALCGYVGVPAGHKYHGVNYDDVPVDVHGGLTYSNECDGSHICHKLDQDAPKVWWLGFDCGHGGDLIPGMLRYYSTSGLKAVTAHDKYRNIDYVKAEVTKLARQLVGEDS